MTIVREQDRSPVLKVHAQRGSDLVLGFVCSDVGLTRLDRPCDELTRVETPAKGAIDSPKPGNCSSERRVCR